MKKYIKASVSHEDINDEDVILLQCDWILENAKELKSLFSYKSSSMVRANNTRALAAIDTMKNSLNELELYIRELENGISASVDVAGQRPVMAGESYGWIVDANEAQEAYDFACEYFGKEELDADIVSCLSSDELADNLAYIFRMNDFEEWYNREG